MRVSVPDFSFRLLVLACIRNPSNLIVLAGTKLVPACGDTHIASEDSANGKAFG